MTFNLSRRIGVLCASTAAALLATLAQPALAVHAYEPHLKPVATISDTRFTLDTPQGHARV
jgi:hypothetical protein